MPPSSSRPSTGDDAGGDASSAVPLTRKVRALAVAFEGYLMGVSVLVGWVVVAVLAAVRVIPDTNEHRWALFSISPVMIAAAALTYTLVTRRFEDGPFASPAALGNLARATGGRDLRRRIEPVPELASVPRALGVALTHTILALGGSMLIALALQALGLEVQEQAVIQEIVAGGLGWRPALIGLGVGAVILAPLTEEWLFRGLLFRRLWLLDAPAAAYLMPALIFAAIHFNPTGLLTYLWLGVVFAHAYRLTGRLWVAMLVHFGNNAFTFAVLLASASAEHS